MREKTPTCCETMDQQLNRSYCSQHGYDCPEYLMRVSRRGHWMLNSGEAWYGCYFCPWCGTEVPEPYNSQKWGNSLPDDWEDDMTWETEE